MIECRTIHLRALQYLNWYGIQEALLSPDHPHHKPLLRFAAQSNITLPQMGKDYPVDLYSLDKENTSQSDVTPNKRTDYGYPNKYLMKINNRYIENACQHRLSDALLYGQDIVLDFHYDSSSLPTKGLMTLCRCIEEMVHVNHLLRSPFRINLCNIDHNSETLRMLRERGVLDNLAVKVSVIYGNGHDYFVRCIT